MTDINQLKYSYSLRLGDNAWILSHRLAEWCSNGPILEEDLALTNLALDLIGRAQGFYKYAAELEGKGKSEDDIAYRRNERQYFNNLIMEMPNGNFADTIARQLYVSVFEYYFFRELKNSKDETFAALAAKTLKEVKYHMAHAADWTIRLGDGTEESHKKMQKALNELWMYTGELFEMNDVDSELMAQGVSVDLSMLKPKWEQHIIDVLKEATLAQPEDIYMQTGSRQGIHTEHLGHILGDMQYLQRAYPDAKW
ncbi:MAG: phenylacetate-CoA oxygenase subunit PaaC [Chitinophagales bacterium]|nr:phenylacetate-CoA oxygenase subunit PaaC [Chitinophagaceae bacterium]MCB9063795.1 phenylacetate-CoA oxygenase subunit PaaC [Chitinophagales bacterium]